MPNQTGFTLIELLVIVLIISILAVLGLPKYEIFAEKGKAAEAITIIKSMNGANERYLLTRGVYAQDLSELDIEITGEKTNNGKEIKAKYFVYGFNTNGGWAERLPRDKSYRIFTMPQPNLLYCRSYSNASAAQEKTCLDLAIDFVNAGIDDKEDKIKH